jgi:hypothetical protein
MAGAEGLATNPFPPFFNFLSFFHFLSFLSPFP